MWYVVSTLLIFLAMVCGYFMGRSSEKYIEKVDLND